jgi:hypothetical protein
MRPKVTLTVPDGLVTQSEGTDNLVLSTSLDPTASEVAVIRVMRSDIIDTIIRINVALVLGTPVPETVAGLAGRAVDIGLPAGSEEPVRLFDTADAVEGRPGTWGMWAGRQERLIELKVGDSTIVVAYDAKAAEYPAFQKIAESIISSISFVSP